MTAVRVITTEQAPSAKPLSASLPLTTEWQTVIDVPVYDVPVVGFGSTRRVAPGVAEPSSPILVTNVSSANVATVDVRLIKSERPLAAAADETAYVDLFTAGVDYEIGNVLVLDNTATITVDNVDANGSVTEFSVTTGGDAIVPETTLTQTGFSGPPGAGTGFSITPDRDNLDINTGVTFLVKGLRVEADDVLIIPINGQFFLSRELLEIRCNESNTILQATLSYTEGQAEEDDIFF